MKHSVLNWSSEVKVENSTYIEKYPEARVQTWCLKDILKHYGNDCSITQTCFDLKHICLSMLKQKDSAAVADLMPNYKMMNNSNETQKLSQKNECSYGNLQPWKRFGHWDHYKLVPVLITVFSISGCFDYFWVKAIFQFCICVLLEVSFEILTTSYLQATLSNSNNRSRSSSNNTSIIDNFLCARPFAKSHTCVVPFIHHNYVLN